MAVQPVVTLDEAIAIAITFAQSSGVVDCHLRWCRHIAEAEYLAQLGSSSGHGTYMIALGNSGRIVEGKVEPAITVNLNDQTGQPHRFLLL
jgi:hypothetical protein